MTDLKKDIMESPTFLGNAQTLYKVKNDKKVKV